jgi:hypothetical protein
MASSRSTAGCHGCQIRFALTGFVPQTRPCPTESLRIVLTSAAIGEYVVVSATRTEAPLSQVGASATVFTAEDLERKQLRSSRIFCGRRRARW